MTVTIIAAVAENGVIGRDNGLPWHLPADLRRFKRLTRGHMVVMGRRTFDSIGGRPLPDRRNIVVSRNPQYHPSGVEVAPDLPGALRLAGPEEDVFVLGGGEIFRQALPLADRLELTVIHARIEGDVTFPPIAAAEWARHRGNGSSGGPGPRLRVHLPHLRSPPLRSTPPASGPRSGGKSKKIYCVSFGNFLS